MIKKCNICFKSFEAGSPNKAKKRRNCSYVCMSLAYKGKTAWNKGKPAPWAKLLAHNFRRGKSSWNRGIPMSKEQKKKLSRKGFRHTTETRRKMSEAHKGSKSNFWRGGITPVNEKIRRTVEYKIWRTSVFDKDNYTCQHCGVRGGELNADHIKPFSIYKELRFDINNGRTLCVLCHKKTNTYGLRGRKLSELHKKRIGEANKKKVSAMTEVPLPNSEEAGFYVK